MSPMTVIEESWRVCQTVPPATEPRTYCVVESAA
jgi:hypothetical protein